LEDYAMPADAQPMRCEGCRRPIPAADAYCVHDHRYPGHGRPCVWFCPDCPPGMYMVMLAGDLEYRRSALPTPRAFDAMIDWWNALSDRDSSAEIVLSWHAIDADRNPTGEPVVIAGTTEPRDGITREGRIRLANALPPDELLWPIWWHPLEPLTWWLWDEAPATLEVSERRGPRGVLQEVLTAATDYGDPGDPGMYHGGASATVAAAWWYRMLAPIHVSRVALLREGPAGAVRVAIHPEDRTLIGAPVPRVSDPDFPDQLAARTRAAERIIEGLGWPVPRFPA
jgi:hypothetical protein